ncbi:hypothetical protein FB446DRAFT_795566 [Lentinula raphanica]|nr:hypothetical protein FB446DRAFT_795566 [Lentinula raphanica]
MELAKRKSTVYTFFEAQPEIQFARDHSAEYPLYRCSKCSETIRQGLKTGDRGSTGNLREHVKKCWEEEALTAVKDSTLEKAQAAVRDFKKTKQTTLTLVVNSVTSWFKSFSTRPPEKEKIRVVTARWVAESGRSFLVVRDRGFRWLQKEGPSAKSPCLWRLQGHPPNPEQPQSNKSALESLGISGHL